MLEKYEEALTVFGIKSGFVEAQIEELYQTLISQYDPNVFEFLSPEYCHMSEKKYQLTRNYHRLCEPFSHYIVDQNSKAMKEEQMIEEISKLIYDYNKSSREMDKRFIAQVIELLVSYKNLHDYVEDIEFHNYSKDSIAEYSETKTLIIYETNFRRAFRFARLEKIEKYYYSVSIFGHEMEHANQRKQRKQQKDNIQAFLWKACYTYFDKEIEFFEHIMKFPNPFFFILSVVGTIISNKNKRKYMKNWHYCPEERVANIFGNHLALTLIEHAQNKRDLQNIRNILNDEMMKTLFFGYDKPLGPTDFYLSRFKQYDDCLKLLELAKSLTLEERLFLGLQVTQEELENAKANKEKMLSGIRKIC